MAAEEKPRDASPDTADEPLPETFEELGVIEPLCEACRALQFKKPTPIQAKAIPEVLAGRDVIGLAQTGSGKTAAYSLPLLQALWDEPRALFACVLAPTRELSYQISQQIEALGATIGVRCATIVGGMDMMTQSIALSKRPHVVVATPGRLQDHLENTKGFSLRTLRYLVMDEADRLLDLDFGPIIDKLLQNIPKERRTMLFSATMTTKVAKLQRASLRNPVRVEIGTKYVRRPRRAQMLTPSQVLDRVDAAAVLPVHALRTQGHLPRAPGERAGRADDHCLYAHRARCTAAGDPAAPAGLLGHPAARPAVPDRTAGRAEQVQGGRAQHYGVHGRGGPWPRYSSGGPGGQL